jgi:hypothetical protein
MFALLALAALALAAPQDPIRRPAPPESRPDARAADFESSDVRGEPFRLSQACGDGWVLLVFVRGMW